MRKLAPSVALLVLITLAGCAREPAAEAQPTQPVAPVVTAPAEPSAPAVEAAPVEAAPVAAEPSSPSAATPVAANSAPAAALANSRWIAGTNYRPLTPPQPTNVAKDKVEVVEVFWYGCNHCYALEPVLKSWEKTKPGYIEFVKVPVVWGPQHKQHARLFYTLEALKRPDLHAKVFDEFHQRGNMLLGNNEAEGRALHLKFARANGISEADFDQAYDSFDVDQKTTRAEQLTRRYQVDGVPRVIINGKFSTDVGMAGGQTNLVALINDVAASERG
jgi:protein dithiol oxidoreductase (disulfide-forming)